VVAAELDAVKKKQLRVCVERMCDPHKGTLSALRQGTCDSKGAFKLNMCDDDTSSSLRLWRVHKKGKVRKGGYKKVLLPSYMYLLMTVLTHLPLTYVLTYFRIY
tara:strand:+ start:87 stop:398 length:312 start_codon:yes stop_codon:yes gene_type:complete